MPLTLLPLFHSIHPASTAIHLSRSLSIAPIRLATLSSSSPRFPSFSRLPSTISVPIAASWLRRPTAVMAPKQATLGKFFKNPNPSKTQTTLSFATKSKPSAENSPPEPPKKAAEASAPSSSPTTEEGSDADFMEVDAPVSAAGSDIGRKRPSKEEPTDSEDEPPVKRQRRKPAEKKELATQITQAATKKASRKSKAEIKEEKQSTKTVKPSTKIILKEDNIKREEEEEEAEAPVMKSSKKTNKKVKEEEESGERVSPATSKRSQSPPSGAESAVEADPDPKDEDVASEEEDEEITAKAREKVQTTLKSKHKDPYPDWKPGEPVPYAALCTTFSKIEMTTKRLEIMAHCSLFLRQVLRLTPKDLLPTILLMINKLAADYAGIELGIGESLIMKAVAESTGRSLKVIKEDQNEIGDLGLVAAKSRGNQPTMFKPKPLTVRGVHEGMMAIATTEGQGAQGRKVAGIKKLLSAADAHLAGKGSKGIDITKDKGGPSEAKYIVRTLEGKLRLGLAEKTVLVALAQAVTFHEISEKDGKIPSTEKLAQGESILKSVYSELPSYEVIIPVILEHGIFQLRERCKLQPGVPLKPMLAKPTKSITEVLDRFEGKDFTCEYKYDGERAQIHFVAHDAPQEYATAVSASGKSAKGVANIFSRNSEDLSKKYPDILVKLPHWVKDGTKSFVLDCETVAWDMEEKKVLPFQQLMTRKRKDVKVEDVKVKVCVFAFDLLYLNGEALVNQPFRERRKQLHEAFVPTEGEFAFAKYGDTNDLDEIQNLLEDSVKSSCEGLMVKMLDGSESSYEPSKRSQNWLKVKKDYLSGVGDSLDLVVIGAYFGKGKRTSWYGAFLLACYNQTTQNYESVCNIGTGFSETLLEELHKQLKEIVIDRPKPFYVHSSGNKDQPDVWFEPKLVWEVKTADLTLSPRYKAAADVLHGNDGKGVSLRFPRFLKSREDKKPEQASTHRQIAEMYQRQESVSKNKGPSVDDDFEY